MGQNASAEADPNYNTSDLRRLSKMPTNAEAAVIARELENIGGNKRNEELFPQISALDADKLTALLQFVEKRIVDFKREIDGLSAEDNAGFAQVFQDIGNVPFKPATASELHKHLNRYNNIFAYDDTRVRISPKKINFNSDYVNANWIPGERSAKQYIATQGPVPDSFDSFWQMVWETGSNTIVMVTNEVEGGKLKCHRYWPVKDEESDGKLVYGDDSLPLWVAAQGETAHPTYIERKFTLSQKGETRSITQLAYTAWPDHGVPTTTKEILNFRSEIFNAGPRGPLIIHCSAGVGRTGTMIAIDRFIEATLSLKVPDIAKIVKDLRDARNYMVQGQFQFMYIYAATMDALQRLLETIKREAKMRGMTIEERRELEIAEVDQELRRQAQIFEAVKASQQEQPKYTEKGGIIPQARHAEGKPTDDVKAAAAVPAAARKESLMTHASDERAIWKDRQNVPITVEEKGYKAVHAVKVGDRKNALSAAQEQWLHKYNDAKSAWQKIQSGDGETFDVAVQLTPIQSRVMSLSTAEESWRARGDGFRSLKEADIRENLASLAVRFQSLQHTSQRPRAAGSPRAPACSKRRLARTVAHAIRWTTLVGCWIASGRCSKSRRLGSRARTRPSRATKERNSSPRMSRASVRRRSRSASARRRMRSSATSIASGARRSRRFDGQSERRPRRLPAPRQPSAILSSRR